MKKIKYNFDNNSNLKEIVKKKSLNLKTQIKPSVSNISSSQLWNTVVKMINRSRWAAADWKTLFRP